MSEKTITVLANEQSRSVPEGFTVGELRKKIKPDADVLVVYDPDTGGLSLQGINPISTIQIDSF